MSSSAASPDVLTATSPSSLASAPSASHRPSLCMKPLSIATSPPASAGSPTTTLTSREWVIPPRPKPGRKPATDTPPTKRKAQNRAAQRAFRERRAARVGELEEQLKQIEDAHEQEQDDLRVRVTDLEQEVERYQNDLANWIDRCRQLEKELAEANSQPGQHTTSESHPPVTVSAEAVGCGNCTLETRCQCIDDAFNAMNGENIDTSVPRSENRAVSPTGEPTKKRVKIEHSHEMEIDFTSAYSRPSHKSSKPNIAQPASAMADPCGFCQDGTPCICAEMAAEQEQTSTLRAKSPTIGQVHPPRQLAQFTPPPSEGDVNHSAPPPSASRCTSDPGTCSQCQADPNSTLFCKSLAASRSQSGNSSGGCCGGKTAGGGCCQDPSQPSRSTRSRAGASDRQLPPLEGSKSTITLTCADAYTTLSRHPAYERASGEIATWMPKLCANPSNADGRPAMEIDAANVMAVLRDFDRRFGADR